MFTQLRQFFAEAKSEFKKISWPSREDIQGSTAVVCVTIIFVMFLLAAYDLGIMGIVRLVRQVFGK
jgi:preprotein translocase subunit SecE